MGEKTTTYLHPLEWSQRMVGKAVISMFPNWLCSGGPITMTNGKSYLLILVIFLSYSEVTVLHSIQFWDLDVAISLGIYGTSFKNVTWESAGSLLSLIIHVLLWASLSQWEMMERRAGWVMKRVAGLCALIWGKQWHKGETGYALGSSSQRICISITTAGLVCVTWGRGNASNWTMSFQRADA